MSKSVATTYSFLNKKGETVRNFGILDADRPEFDNGTANGLSFGAGKAALLLYQLVNRPDDLISELGDYLASMGVDLVSMFPGSVASVPPTVQAPTPPPTVQAPTMPTVQAPSVGLTPDQRAILMAKGAEMRAAMPPDRPKSPSIYRPGPSIGKPAPTDIGDPIKEATIRGKGYFLFPDGLTRMWMTPSGRAAHWRVVESPIQWDAPINPPVNVPRPPVKAAAPTPPPPPKLAVNRAIYREIESADGSVVVLYVDGGIEILADGIVQSGTYTLDRVAVA